MRYGKMLAPPYLAVYLVQLKSSIVRKISVIPTSVVNRRIGQDGNAA